MPSSLYLLTVLGLINTHLELTMAVLKRHFARLSPFYLWTDVLGCPREASLELSVDHVPYLLRGGSYCCILWLPVLWLCACHCEAATPPEPWHHTAHCEDDC